MSTVEKQAPPTWLKLLPIALTLVCAPIPPLPAAEEAALSIRLGRLEQALSTLQTQLEKANAEREALEHEVRDLRAQLQKRESPAAPPAQPPAPTPQQPTKVPDLKFSQRTLKRLKALSMFKIRGQYRVMGNMSNFRWHDTEAHSHSRDFLNQRFRTWLSVEPEDQPVSALLEVEMGHIVWGENFEMTKTYAGPFTPPGSDDKVGMEVRKAYITYKHPDWGVFDAGIIGWSDSFDDTLASSDWDFNVGGVQYRRALPGIPGGKVKLGAFRVAEGDTSKDQDANLLTSDIDLSLGEHTKAGVSFYYLDDEGQYSHPLLANYDSSYDWWVGARLAHTIGDAILKGFVIHNQGGIHNINGPRDNSHNALAAKAEADYRMGGATWGIQTLYAGRGFRTIAQSERDELGAQGYWSFLGLTSPWGPSDVQDLGIGLQNRGFGLYTIQGKVEIPITKSVSTYLALGHLWSDRMNPLTGSRNIGTEALGEARIDLGGGLSLAFGGGYLLAGQFLKPAAGSGASDNLYELYTRLQFDF